MIKSTLQFMISSIVYTPLTSQIRQGSTFQATKSPLFQIIIAKVAVVLMIFLCGDVFSQEVACIFVTIGCSLEFWMTKNLGRKYLLASWSIDTTGEQEVWVYEANFKSPSSLEEIFWYAQVVYGVILIVSACIILGMHKYSLLCAIVIAWTANYVNFYAFSKIINIRNAGIFDQIAQEVKAEGEVRETIRLPMAHNRNSKIVAQSGIRSSFRSSVIV